MRILSVVLLALTLFGCTETITRPPVSDAERAWEIRRARLASLDSWGLTGRLAVLTDHEGWHATIHWEQQLQNYAIRIIGPLGQGALSLQGDPGHVVLLTGDGERVEAPDPEGLIYKELGWRVPVASLAYWVRGLPAPGPADWTVDSYGRLAKLKQADWEVEFLDYEQHDSLELPGRVFANNDKAKVRLAVSRWDLPTATGTR